MRLGRRGRRVATVGMRADRTLPSCGFSAAEFFRPQLCGDSCSAPAESSEVWSKKKGNHLVAVPPPTGILCGTDSNTGRYYGHRKAWVLDRLRQLAGLFGVEVCDYAIMSNHWTGREIRENKCGAIPAGSDSRPARARSIELGEDGARIRPDVQASGRSREFARAGGAALLATVVSGKDGGPSRFCVRMRIDAARRPI